MTISIGPTRWFMAVCSAAAAVLTSTVVDGASFVGLGFLNSSVPYSIANQVSGNGQLVVGYSYRTDSTVEAFRWTRTEGMKPLGFLPKTSNSVAHGVSASNAVIVGWSYTSGGAGGAFRWTQSKGMTTLQNLNKASPQSTSADGSVIVGETGGQEAFRWTNGSVQLLGFLSGSSGISTATSVDSVGNTVVGYSTAGNGVTEAFIWTSQLGMQPLGLRQGASTYAHGISADGTVVVGSPGFYWTKGGGMHALKGPNGYPAANPQAVSGDGSVIVGCASNHNYQFQAVRWVAARPKKLGSIIAHAGLSIGGWQLNCAKSVSADGNTIVGDGIDPSGNQEAWLFQVQ